jgi:XTP/dITP diphosphohydrolase
MEETQKGNIPAPKVNDRNNILEQFQALYDVVKILRVNCPWDREQTNESIAQLLIEETYEAIDAINNHDDDEFSKELGDILLHIIMHSVMAEERGAFNINTVFEKIREKLVHRHPHVFSDVEVNDQKDVMRNWENLKIQEGRTSLLQGVPKILPALLRAQRLQFKASKVGFDWNTKQGVWDKIDEELKEYRQELENKNIEKAKQELGDIIFAIVNAARFEDIVAEESLQYTNDKFTRRFQYIEQKAKEQGGLLSDMSLEEMDAFWDEAKSLESK